MNMWLDFTLIALAATDFVLLTASRLGQVVRTIAWQGVILGVLPLIAGDNELGVHAVGLAIGATLLKAIIFPAFLLKAIRNVECRREIEPIVGYIASLLFGLVVVGLSIWLTSRLPESQFTRSLSIPVAILTSSTGLFLIVARRKALTQVIGYLTLENGIYVLGVLFALGEPMLVELGVLLDVFVAVFLMGIMIFHISRDFEHIDADRLSVLNDRLPEREPQL